MQRQTTFPRFSHPWRWLAAGALLIALSQLRFGIGLLAWVAPVPFLRYLRQRGNGWRSWLAVSAAAYAGWAAAVFKIVTAPVPAAMAPAFALPMAIAFVLPMGAWAWLRPRVGEPLALIAYAAAVAMVEAISGSVSPLGTWGALAHTQAGDLALLQLASVTGAAGVGFVVALVGATVEAATARVVGGRAIAVVAALLAAVQLGGAIRLALASGSGRELVTVAAIGTDSDISGWPLPPRAVTERWNRGLFDRTRVAARAGARLVVWTEAATLVRPEDETAWRDELRGLARDTGIDLVAGYIVPLPGARRYRNQYLFVRADGSIDHVYRKHRPVPGEPAVPGTSPMPVVDTAFARVSGAICYDFDFPGLVAEQADRGADLVALPSSDWRGIDPIHTEMAAVRAIEQGLSVVRSTRWGLSAGIDPWGRMIGRASAFDGGDRILLVGLPRHRVTTIYGLLGPWFPIACALGLVFLAATHRRRIPLS